MSTETPETPVAATPPTPENVAKMLTMGDNDYHDGNYWHPSIGSIGNVIHIGITPYADDDEGTKLPEVHFRAVVVEGEQTPIVLERPSLEQDWTNPPNDVRSWVSPDYFVCVQTWRTDVAYLTPEQARREAARLAALADEAQKLAGEEIAKRRAEAAQTEKGGTQ